MRTWRLNFRFRGLLFVSGLLFAQGANALAQEMQPPRLSFARVDWTAALNAIANNPAVRSIGPRTFRRASSSASPALIRLNAALSQRFPGIAVSPVPVLLPFDVERLLRDQDGGTIADGNQPYLSGFHIRSFFFPGPSGYHAAFAIRLSEVPELSDLKFAEPIQVHISGSALLYEIDELNPLTGAPVPSLEAEFPGIRRLIHEHHLRYTFIRFGVPYVVSIACFDAGIARYRMPTCRTADQVAARFLRALRVAGGMPKPRPAAEPLPIERPAEVSPDFTYHPPGRLLSGTSFRGRGGRADHTVYSQIRFPIAEAPAFVNSQLFERRNRPMPDQTGSPNYSYPWRDNFCERRGFPVGQCPAGHGHQGQDIRTPLCTAPPGERCGPDLVVAVRDGAILRAPKQEAAYLVVNTANEHIRFRYLHMSPRRMDEDNVLSGRLVNEGEVIGRVGNFHKREGGTSYHLHFDVQVPTKHGWVFINPYMTLVAAYERLIGARGEPIVEPVMVATTDPATTASVATGAVLAEPEKPVRKAKSASSKSSKHAKKSKTGKHAKAKRTKKQRLARR